jgi:Fanconi anemia group M protein
MKHVTVIVDYRELYSPIAEILEKKGANVVKKQLVVGDYIISERIGVERKRSNDFLDSLVNKRLFNQIKRLAEAYEKPVMIIEEEGLFSRNIDKNAIYGALASILSDYGSSIIQTRGVEETADILFALARREQLEQKKEIALRGKKPYMSQTQYQQFILEGLPFVSSITAKKLLEYFGSIRRVINATINELCEVEGIGKKKALVIKEIIDRKWAENNNEQTTDH